MNHESSSPLRLALVSAVASALTFVPASAPALTDGDLRSAIDQIRRVNSPRYLVWNHDKICEDFEAFAKTNTFTYAQQAQFNHALAYNAVFLKDHAKYEAAYAALDGLTNATIRLRELGGLFGDFIYIYRGATEYKQAARIFDENEKLFNERQRVEMNAKLANRAIDLFRDQEIFRKRFDAALAVSCPAGNPASTNSFRGWRGDRIVDMINKLLSADIPAGTKLFDEKTGELAGDGQRDRVLVGIAEACVGVKDRPAFDAILARVRAYPPERRTSSLIALLHKMKGFDRRGAERIALEEIGLKSDAIDKWQKSKPAKGTVAGGNAFFSPAGPAIPPARRQAYLSVVQNINTPSIWNYGFNTPGQYERYRDVVRARLAIEAANPDDKGCRVGDLSGIVDVAIWYDDLAFAQQLIDLRLPTFKRLNGGEAQKLLRFQARIQAIRGDAPAAVTSLQAILDGPCNAGTTNDILPVVAFLQGKGLAGFDAAVAPRNLQPAGRLAALRRASRQLFEMRRYDDCRAIYDEITQKMYEPDVVKTVRATFVADAPKSADGFARSPYFADWKAMETRFEPYGGGYGESAKTDEEHHLRGAKKPEVKPGYPTGVRVLADPEGVHFYIRCDDPAIEEVRLGKRKAGGLEIVFRPGDAEKCYYSIFFTDLPGCSDPHDCEWAMPGRHYRRAHDVIHKDAALTASGTVGHVHVSWADFFDSLPVDGVDWRFGVIRSGASGMISTGGVVHELSRSLVVHFDFTPAQLAALRRDVATTAYNRYAAFRNDAGGALQMWDDKELGDPDFYKAAVAPLVERLDAEGKKLLGGKDADGKEIKPADDAAVAKLFDEIVPLWANIKYELAERRTRYLGDKLFAE